MLVPLTATLLGLALLLTALGWQLHGNRAVGILLVATTVAVALLVGPVGSGLDEQLRSDLQRLPFLAGLTLLGIAGGGPVTAAAFRFVDGPDAARAGSVSSAEAVLRGGTWIGVLERIAVSASLLSGWPEGLALTLALKGLGRYPELRHEERPGIAERFLIGTFVSVLWAAGCAGLAVLVR